MLNFAFTIKGLILIIFVAYISYILIQNNHIQVDQPKNEQQQQNNCNITQKQKLVIINTDRAVESKIIKQYFLNKTCEYKVVHKYYYKQTPANYFFQWAHFYWDIDFKTFRSGNQIVNHIENSQIFDDKNYLLVKLRQLDQQNLYKHINSSIFMPKTFLFDVEKSKYTHEEKTLSSLPDDNKMWIAKNPNGCCGKGIKLVNNFSVFQQEIIKLKSQKGGDKSFFRYKQISQYIDNPLIINGKKAEYRAYILVACSNPLLVIFNKGFIKTALKNYTMDSLNKEVHLTNLAEARLHEEYQQVKDSAYLNIEQFEDFLKKYKQFQQSDIDNMYNKMKQILAYTFQSGVMDFKGQFGQFDTYAIDILFDQNMNQYLLEINQPYAVEGSELPGYRDVLPQFYFDSLDLVLQINSMKQQDMNEFLKKPFKLSKNMDILINEATNFNYNNENQQ